MAKTSKKRSDYPDYKTSISDEMKRRQAEKPQTGVPDQIIEVQSKDYRRLKNMVSSQLRRKLAGEFPFNVLGREVEVSTNTFWMEVLSTHAEAYWEHQDYPKDLFTLFVKNVGEHPGSWKSIEDIESLEWLCDAFVEKHRGN